MPLVALAIVCVPQQHTWVHACAADSAALHQHACAAPSLATWSRAQLHAWRRWWLQGWICRGLVDSELLGVARAGAEQDAVHAVLVRAARAAVHADEVANACWVLLQR